MRIGVYKLQEVDNQEFSLLFADALKADENQIKMLFAGNDATLTTKPLCDEQCDDDDEDDDWKLFLFVFVFPCVHTLYLCRLLQAPACAHVFFCLSCDVHFHFFFMCFYV